MAQLSQKYGRGCWGQGLGQKFCFNQILGLLSLQILEELKCWQQESWLRLKPVSQCPADSAWEVRGKKETLLKASHHRIRKGSMHLQTRPLSQGYCPAQEPVLKENVNHQGHLCPHSVR